jgi:hypothetical protein
MKSIGRFMSGSLLGVALLMAAFATKPAAAYSAGGFCNETANYVCCCSTNPDGSINDCSCMKKIIEAT